MQVVDLNRTAGATLSGTTGRPWETFLGQTLGPAFAQTIKLDTTSARLDTEADPLEVVDNLLKTNAVPSGASPVLAHCAV